MSVSTELSTVDVMLSDNKKANSSCFSGKKFVSELHASPGPDCLLLCGS